MGRLSLHPLAAASEMGDLADTLAEDGLPHDDLSDPGRQFYAIRRADRRLGYIGVEGSGSDRLLRSFVILADHRSGGLGSKALAMLESLARDEGTEHFHLLTTTAAPFFRRNGYQAARREDAPAAIGKSREFTTLCPASADYLVKTL